MDAENAPPADSSTAPHRPDPGHELERRLAHCEAELARAREALATAVASHRESQSFFAKSFHSSPALMSIASAVDGRLIEVNPAFIRGSGYAREEAIGRTTLELGLWLHPPQRDEFIRRITADRVIRDLEADFRGKTGNVRTLLLNADIMEFGGVPCMLTVGVDITERRRRDQVQAATYEISRAVLGGDDLPALLAKVHRIIAGLVPAKNCYVALLNSDRSIISFPYFVDELMPPIAPRPPRNGITEYVIATARPLLAGDAEIIACLKTRPEPIPTGYQAAQWLGAPLVVEGKSIGVIAVQDYHNPNAYTADDLKLLVFVAEQTAAAIHRQQVEAAQRESRAYFEKSFHSSPALMAISRVKDGMVTEVNPAFLRGYGFTREEVLGRTTTELGLWTHAGQRAELMRRMLTDGKVRDLEVDIRDRNGAVRSLIVNADIIELGGERCTLTVGIDITERRRRDRVQAAVYQISQIGLAGGDLNALFAEVHRILADLMAAQNFYVALLSADGTLLSFPYFVDEHVRSPQPRKPANGFTEYVLETGRPLLASAAELPALLSARGHYQSLDRPAAQRIGTPLLIGGRAIGVIALQDYANPRAYDEEDLRLLTFVAEQTAAAVHRREAEVALRKAEQQYRSIFENALEGLYQTTPSGRFIRTNTALARICGYATPQDLMTAVNDIGSQIYIDPGRRAEFLRLVEHSDELPDFESEIYRADGSKIWISESVRAIRNADGTIDHFEGVAADITTKREAARALQAAKEAADAANRSKSYFLASVSHELRTPLNGILGYTQILRRDPTLTEKQHEGVRVIHDSADHLLALINDVLDLTKIEASRIELHATDFNLPDFAASMERFFTPRAREKNLLFETALAADLPRFVRGDEQRLRQVVFNLLANAVKFTATGGVVYSVQRGPADVIRFAVSDTGPGIAAEDLKKLFEPFSQVGRSQNTSAGGTGLGLAISRSLVERMGGKLQFESKPGWGSRFWFEVPLPAALSAAPAAPTTARRVLGYEGERRRVLIVDDNAANRAVMAKMLAPLGFDLAEVADGESVLAEAAEFKPDLVLMDLRLPDGIDGFEATRRLRQTEIGRTAKIIAVSASAYDLDRAECFTAGCDAFLAKPFREEELWTAVGQALSLVWRLADGVETRTPFPFVGEPPPPAEADALHELAAKGDVVGVRSRAEALLEQDPRFTPFAQHVLDLAARFRMKAIRKFVAPYGTHPAP